MIVAVFSIKGSPGVSSTALALAATWPRPVILVEADPSGGDLAYRCSAAAGGPIAPTRGLLSLATQVRSAASDPDTLAQHAQELGCGVGVVQGINPGGQFRGLAGLWGRIADAVRASNADVILDLGRLEATTSVQALLGTADVFVPVATATVESVMHLAHGLGDALSDIPTTSPSHSQGDGWTGEKPATGQDNGGPPPNTRRSGPDRAQETRWGVRRSVCPVLVTADNNAMSDCVDLDLLLAGHANGLAQDPSTTGATRLNAELTPTRPMSYDPRALARLEAGEDPRGRLGRTLLIRSARQITWGDTTSSAAPVPATDRGASHHADPGDGTRPRPKTVAIGGSPTPLAAPAERWMAPRAGTT